MGQVKRTTFGLTIQIETEEIETLLLVLTQARKTARRSIEASASFGRPVETIEEQWCGSAMRVTVRRPDE